MFDNAHVTDCINPLEIATTIATAGMNHPYLTTWNKPRLVGFVIDGVSRETDGVAFERARCVSLFMLLRTETFVNRDAFAGLFANRHWSIVRSDLQKRCFPNGPI